MNSRNGAILRLLSEKRPGYTTIDKIALETGAGIRTIHRDLEGLERSLRLRGVRLERRRGYGIRLIDPLPEELISGLPGYGTSVPAESGQRPMLILIYLIISGDWVKLGSVASALFVSDSTISTDLGYLDRWLPSSLRLERLKGTGVRLLGPEEDIRFLFLSLFASMFPYYLINSDSNSDSRDARVMEALEIRRERSLHNARIQEAEQILGLEFSSYYRGFLYSYLFLISRRLRILRPLSELSDFRLDVPGLYVHTAAAMIAGTLPSAEPDPGPAHAEILLLARILASCEVARPSEASVDVYLGKLKDGIEAVIEHSLGRLEGKERIWLHDDRKFLNYMRMVIGAAAHRVDLGISAWWEYRLHPFPGIHETPESAVLVSQFLADLGLLLGEPDPAVVRREVQEGALAVAARLEEYRNRGASGLRVKVLCYEGLGMASYIRSLARDVFPGGTQFSSHWEPDFATHHKAGDFDLVISTFPLRLNGTPTLLINGSDSAEDLRRTLRQAAEEMDTGRIPSSRAKEESPDGDSGNSLDDLLAIVHSFSVVQRNPDEDLIHQASGALDRGDCDLPRLIQDFIRRESYGRLEFEEVGVRVLHCRSDGIPAPRAAVVQNPEIGDTVLVLSAPISASQSETHGLSEIVIALTEVPEMPEILGRGSRKEIQKALMALFGQRNG